MATSRKTLKMRRRNTKKNKKTNKKGGVGMLTPPGSPIQQQGSPNFIDVDTPGSMHLSELGNPNSGITDRDSDASGFQGLNLTQQFDDAASDSFDSVGDNSLSSSMDNAVPGQPNDANSFGSLGHGGKRKRKMKGGRKTRKHKKRLMKGGVRTWDQLPQEVEHRVYASLPEEELAHYSDECFHKKNQRASIGNQEILRRQSAERARVDSVSRRMQEIARDPNAKIRQDEYDSLPQQEKQNWVASGTEGPQWDQTTIYRRRQPSDDLNWRARNTPNIHLDERQYAALDAVTKALGWVRVVESNYRDSNVYYRRRVTADDELDQAKATIQRLTSEREQILAAVRPVKTGHMIDEASMPKFSIRTDRDAYVTLPQDRYNRYMVLSNLLEEEEAKKSRLESQLHRL
jgi:hypothetical protein